MAVTTTFNLDFVQNLDLTQGPSTAQADATSLANGGFAVSGFHVGHTDLDIFNSDLTDGGGANVITGTLSAIDQLINGNIALVSQDADSIRFTVRGPAGGVVVAETDIGDTGSSAADVAALNNGNFVVVNQDFFGGTDFDIDVRIFAPGGGAALVSFPIDSSGAQDNNPAVCALDDGGFAVAWTRTVGGNTQVFRAVFEANGAVRSGPVAFDTFGTVNRNVDISAKNGGFVVVYEDNGWGTGTNDITLAEFSSAGAFQSFSNISNPNFINDGSNDANAKVTRLANGLLVVGFEDNSFADTDNILALYDANSNTVLTTRNITGGESVVDDVGDITAAGFGLGRIGVFQTNNTDGDADGEALQGRRNASSDAAGDAIFGDDFVDIFNGNDGADFLFGANNNDSLSGGNQDDTLQGGDGADTESGGNGNDTFILNTGDLDTGQTLSGNAGGDRVLINSSVALKVAVVQSIEEIEFGGGGTLFTTLAANQLGGAVFNNALVIDGRNGAQDKIFVQLLTDTAVNLGAWSFVDWISGGGDQDLIKITGDADAENIKGSIQRDFIFGLGAADTIYGNLGSDVLNGGGDADRFVFDTALGLNNIDRINGFQINSDRILLDNDVFTGLPAGILNADAFFIGANAADAEDRIIYNSINGGLFFDADGVGGAAKVRFASLATGLGLDNLDFLVIG